MFYTNKKHPTSFFSVIFITFLDVSLRGEFKITKNLTKKHPPTYVGVFWGKNPAPLGTSTIC
jgi:hypothetical protein